MIEISDYTGEPELFEGRLKTLHPMVHGGLLHRRDNEEHVRQAKENGIKPIDLVCVNLYPFEETVARPGVTLEEAIEKIDIGGPSMLRSAAKNYASVTVVSDPADYARILDEMQTHKGDTTLKTRENLAVKVFMRTSITITPSLIILATRARKAPRAASASALPCIRNCVTGTIPTRKPACTAASGIFSTSFRARSFPIRTCWTLKGQLS